MAIKNKIIAALSAILMLIGAVFAAFFGGSRSGRKKAEAKQNEEIIKKTQEVNDAYDKAHNDRADAEREFDKSDGMLNESDPDLRD